MTGKNPFEKLDKAFENRVRLQIMSVLMVNERYDFNSLKELLDITDGNLASHLKALEKDEYISVNKSFLGRKPNTNYAATETGKKAFKQHLDALELLIKQQKKG
ncbi:MAG: transcriptional regulator [Mucilaginibacter sp.]